MKTEDGSLSEEKLKEFLTAAKGIFELDTYSTEEYNTEVKNYSIWNGILYGSLSGTSRLGYESVYDIGTVTDYDRVQSIYGAEKQLNGNYRPFGGKTHLLYPMFP